ncbi:MAG: hypothetical protein JWR24_97 [Actinoallomurus sp.]|nr:hypothetical protein [Actinoallomurus sp.]
MTLVIRDHPGWTSAGALSLRALGSGARRSAVAVNADDWHTYGSASAEPDVFDLVVFPPSVPSSLAHSLAAMGPVVRWRNPDLWDALATAIIRQVIRADQARLLYRRFCAAHGEPVDTPHGTVHVMPDAAAVAELPAEEFQALGMAFKRSPLQAAALAYLDHGGKWCELSPRRLVEELQTVPRIGPWTAGATAADFTHEWTLYPYGDLAVRKRAVAAAPDIDWPAKEDAFAARWRDITAGQLGPITVLTLAFGGHHGDSP